MAYKERDIERVYWTIGEVSEMLNMNASAVRFWCDELKLDIKRNSAGSRLFNKKSIRLIAAIKYLLFVEHFTLKGVSIKIDLWQKGKYKIPEESLRVEFPKEIIQFKPFEKVELDESITDCPGHTVNATIVALVGDQASISIENRCEGCSCGPASRIINTKWLKRKEVTNE